jgi:DNA repair protein RecO (recombination protein O)
MYSIHTTPGFILSSRPYGEAGKLLSIFTEEFGLVRATAQGIRVEKSKLRPFIQDYSFGLYSFVRGKEYWRLTNAQEIDVPVQTNELTARIASLLSRLLQGEEAHVELFKVLDSLLAFISKGDMTDPEPWKTLESLVVIRILHRLGYIPAIAGLELEISSNSIDSHMLKHIEGKRAEMNIHINRALKESHL